MGMGHHDACKKSDCRAPDPRRPSSSLPCSSALRRRAGQSGYSVGSQGCQCGEASSDVRKGDAQSIPDAAVATCRVACSWNLSLQLGHLLQRQDKHDLSASVMIVVHTSTMMGSERTGRTWGTVRQLLIARRVLLPLAARQIGAGCIPAEAGSPSLAGSPADMHSAPGNACRLTLAWCV